MAEQDSNSDEYVHAPRFVVVADDLTGACDAVVPFALRGLKTEVFPRGLVEDVDHAEALALNTDSRDVDEQEMRGRLERLIPVLLQGDRQVVKKIDSVFRGNTFAEIALTAQLAGDRLVAIAPAFPEAGRICIGGQLRINDLSGERGLSLLHALEDRGCRPALIEAGRSVSELTDLLREMITAGQRSFLFDATFQQDMERIVAVLEAMPEEVLWIGSAGLTKALALSVHLRSAAAPKVREGSVLFLIGSDHAVTQAQIDGLMKECPVATLNTAREHREIAAGSPMLYRIQRGVTTPQEIEDVLKSLDPGSLACLFVTGGDTASLLCEALAIDRLRITDEFAHGVPIGTVCGGNMDGTVIILKSGGFGDADLFLRIVKAYTAKETH